MRLRFPKWESLHHLSTRLTTLLETRFLRRYQIARLSRNVKHISGSLDFSLADNQLVVVCLVRNGEQYIRAFIRHYQNLGASRIIFLDNASDDGTIDLLKEYPDVTVLATDLPFKHYKLAMRTFLIERFGRNRWSLYVDIDEFFDFPFSDRIPLHCFLDYLNEKSYSAVVAHMLDMFSENPILEIQSEDNEPLKSRYRYYDISDLTRMDYFFRNQLDSDIKIYFGGIRRTIFGTDYEHGLILSKHPLIFLSGKIRPIYPHEHGVRNAQIADVTCVLLHYKFTGDFMAKTLRNVVEGNYHLNSIEYKRYLKILEEKPDLQLVQDTSRYLNHIDDLVENGFLMVSDSYTDWVNQKAQSDEWVHYEPTDR